MDKISGKIINRVKGNNIFYMNMFCLQVFKYIFFYNIYILLKFILYLILLIK